MATEAFFMVPQKVYNSLINKPNDLIIIIGLYYFLNRSRIEPVSLREISRRINMPLSTVKRVGVKNGFNFNNGIYLESGTLNGTLNGTDKPVKVHRFNNKRGTANGTQSGTAGAPILYIKNIKEHTAFLMKGEKDRIIEKFEGTDQDQAFEELWALYPGRENGGRSEKGSKKTAKAKFKRLTNIKKAELISAVIMLVIVEPDKKFLFNFSKYIGEEIYKQDLEYYSSSLESENIVIKKPDPNCEKCRGGGMDNKTMKKCGCYK